MMGRWVLAVVAMASVLLVGCAGNPFDDDPLLKPPQVVEIEKEKKP